MTTSPGRRGRVAACPDTGAGPAAGFARCLWELKQAAGDPSYDRMRDELGALASRSALSAAARGRRLPSWETTWEFVRALAVGVLGEDEETARREWRARWECARAGGVGEPAAVVRAAPARARRRWWLVAATVGGAVLLVAGVLAGVRELGAAPPEEKSASSKVASSEPPAAPPGPAPLIPGDASDLVDDITIPDGTAVPTGSVFIKTWLFRNIGSVPWIGRSLRRGDSFGVPACRTRKQVPIPTTRPGETVRISVEVRAPDEPGFCRVYWKMVDGKGRVLLPDHRGAFFQVRVVA